MSNRDSKNKNIDELQKFLNLNYEPDDGQDLARPTINRLPAMKIKNHQPREIFKPYKHDKAA